MNKLPEEEDPASVSYNEYVSNANAAEDVAKNLDRKGHSFPIEVDMFLEAAKYSRKAAGFQRLANQRTKVPLLRSIALSNYHSMLGNTYKSLGNYFYYSVKLSRAATFFQRAINQYAKSDQFVPKELDKYISIVQNSLAQQVHLEALIADCKGGLSKAKDDWVEASKHYRIEQAEYKKLKLLDSDYPRSLNLDAVIQATEREIKICQAIISLKNGQLDKALKHADSAVTAAEMMLQKEPDWRFFQRILGSTVSLRESVKHLIDLKKVSIKTREETEKFLERADSHLCNLLSYKFEKEVEYYLREEYQYSISRTRYKPPYLGREIDVYATKGGKKITICECKLRFKNQPITANEIEDFVEIVKKVRRYEQKKAKEEGKQILMHFWFVTNSSDIERPASNVARKNKIKTMQAVLPRNLISNVNWRISSLHSVDKR